MQPRPGGAPQSFPVSTPPPITHHAVCLGEASVINRLWRQIAHWLPVIAAYSRKPLGLRAVMAVLIQLLAMQGQGPS